MPMEVQNFSPFLTKYHPVYIMPVCCIAQFAMSTLRYGPNLQCICWLPACLSFSHPQNMMENIQQNKLQGRPCQGYQGFVFKGLNPGQLYQMASAKTPFSDRDSPGLSLVPVSAPMNSVRAAPPWLWRRPSEVLKALLVIPWVQHTASAFGNHKLQPTPHHATQCKPTRFMCPQPTAICRATPPSAPRKVDVRTMCHSKSCSLQLMSTATGTGQEDPAWGLFRWVWETQVITKSPYRVKLDGLSPPPFPVVCNVATGENP